MKFGKGEEVLNTRLEALRLAHTPGQPVEEVVGRARRYEHYLEHGTDLPKQVRDNPEDPFK